MEDCFNKINEDDIRVGVSKRHTGLFTVIIKRELQNECIKSRLKRLEAHDSEDKKFLIVDEP
jgi:hypothetical protein